MDTAIQKSDKRVREKLNQWRREGCPVADADGVLDIDTKDKDCRREWYALTDTGEPVINGDKRRPTWAEFCATFIVYAESSTTKASDNKEHYNKLQRVI